MSRSLAAFGMTLFLAACGGAGPVIRPQVLTPPPSQPRTEFMVEAADVQSREAGEDAWQRNAEYGQVLVQALRSALKARGKIEVPPPADVIRPRIYLAYSDAPVSAKGSKRANAHVEVRLQLLDRESGAIRYSTHTQTPIKPGAFASWGWGLTRDQIIREALQKAAEDFVSRL